MSRASFRTVRGGLPRADAGRFAARATEALVALALVSGSIPPIVTGSMSAACSVSRAHAFAAIVAAKRGRTLAQSLCVAYAVEGTAVGACGDVAAITRPCRGAEAESVATLSTPVAVVGVDACAIAAVETEMTFVAHAHLPTLRQLLTRAVS